MPRAERDVRKAGTSMGMWPKRRGSPRPLLPQVLLLLAIIAFLVGSYYGTLWYWERTCPAEVTVPKLVGLTEREATAVLESMGLRGEVVAKKPDEEIPEGAVLSAEPPPERLVRESRLIRITLSSGSRWAVVPDVRERAGDRARARLRKAGLAPGREKAVFDSKVPSGHVVGQVPDSGEQVSKGMGIDLLVSKGPAPPPLPPVDVGAGADGARSTTIDFVVPPGAGLQEVRVVVHDDGGETEVYSKVHERGDRVALRVTGKGTQISVKVYLSGELIRERTF